MLLVGEENESLGSSLSAVLWKHGDLISKLLEEVEELLKFWFVCLFVCLVW